MQTRLVESTYAKQDATPQAIVTAFASEIQVSSATPALVISQPAWIFHQKMYKTRYLPHVAVQEKTGIDLLFLIDITASMQHYRDRLD